MLCCSEDKADSASSHSDDMSENEDADHPRFFVGADDGEGEELLDPGRVLGYDCLYENVEEEDEDGDEEEYDSVCWRVSEGAIYSTVIVIAELCASRMVKYGNVCS